MSRHKEFRIRVAVEQVLQDGGRPGDELTDVIVHEERTYRLFDGDFSAALTDPLKAAQAAVDYERAPKLGET